MPALRQALAEYLTGLHARRCREVGSRSRVRHDGGQRRAHGDGARRRPRRAAHGPAWPNPANAARLRGARRSTCCELDPVPEGGFRLDLDRLAAKLRGARAFVLNSPNNPTGWTRHRRDLEAILDLCRRHGVWLISDEVYSRLVYDGAEAAPSLLDIAAPEDRVIVCNSFSKAGR